VKFQMKTIYGFLKLFLNEALLELVLLSCLLFGSLAVCPSDCSCSRSHREVDCSWKGLRQLPDGLQYNIRSLVLSHNRFHSLDGKLQQYTHLRSLDLSHNRLSRLPKTLPRSLWQLSWNLQTLDLSNNKLERAIFINNTLINLLTLNLRSLDRLPRLTHFYLHANRFSSLPSGVLDNMVSLRIITLSSNPWACHLYEDMAYLLSWAQQTSVLVLGCPCHTQPVCGGLRPSRSGGLHFASYTSPPLAAKTPDLSSVPPEARVTWWWQLLAQLSTPHTPKDTSNLPPSSTFTTDTHLAINHLPATARWKLSSFIIKKSIGKSHLFLTSASKLGFECHWLDKIKKL
uniref:Oligodendrocyte-myelin glycoprotein n=1 Tax=Oryzias latipes TaxID=8090 RepID=A0A3P9H7X4_ORYLA